MAKITYTDHERSAPYVKWMGVEFTHGQPVDVDDGEQLLIAKARENPWFTVEGSEARRGSGRPRKDEGGAAQ